MPPIAVAGAVVAAGAIGSAAIQSNAARRAGRAQARAADRASEIQLEMQREAIQHEREMFDISREDLRPYREVGARTLGQLSALNQPGQYFQQDFDFTLEDFQADPGYQFRLSEGMKALERSASARGMVLSGGQLKDIQRFGQNLASDEFSRAYGRAGQRFFANREARFGRLASLAGIGQTSAAQSAGFASQTGGRLANISLGTGARLSDIALQRGNARASAHVAQGRALAGGLQGITQGFAFGLGGGGGQFF